MYNNIILWVACECHLWKTSTRSVQAGFIFFTGNWCVLSWKNGHQLKIRINDCKHAKMDRDLCAINIFSDGNKNNLNTCIKYNIYFNIWPRLEPIINFVCDIIFLYNRLFVKPRDMHYSGEFKMFFGVYNLLSGCFCLYFKIDGEIIFNFNNIMNVLLT